MAVLSVTPETTHRDWDDIIKYPGRFGEFMYNGADLEPEEVWDLTHRVEWAPPAAAAGGGNMLDPLHRYLAVKNYGVDPVLLHFNTQANSPNEAFEVTILPGHWVEYVDLWMTVQPSIRVDSALYSSPMECEVLQIGEFTELDQPPEEFCDLWAVGRETQTGGLTRHNPEATPTLWDTIPAVALADPGEYSLWLADVAGVATDDYWAVGYTQAVNPNGGVFAFWNDVAWAWTVINGEPPQYGVWGFATADYYSVGGPVAGDGVVWHGPAWVESCTPNPDGAETLYCVHGHDATLVWVAGMDGLIAFGTHGGGFAVSQSGVEDEHYYGVWSESVTNQWVVGGDGDWWGTSGGTGVIRRNSIIGWQVQHNTGPTLRAIWGFNEQDIWAVGDQGTILHTADGGTNWDAVPEPAELGGNYDYRGVFGCKPWAVWAVGTNGIGEHVTIFWDGLTWEIDDGPTVEGDLLGLKGVWVSP